MFKTIFSISFFVIAAIVALAGALLGRKKRWQLSAARLIFTLAATAISVLASIIIGRALGSALSDPLSVLITDTMPELSGVEELGAISSVLAASLIAPLLFYVLFTVLKLISGGLAIDLGYIFMRLNGDAADAEIERRLDAAERGIDDSEFILRRLKAERRLRTRRRMHKKELRATERNILGAVCGSICTLVIFIICLMPASGMITVASDVVPFIASTAIAEMSADIPDIVDDAADSAGVVTARALGGDAMYSAMTTHSLNGRSVKLANETKFISEFNDGFIASVLYVDDEESDEARKARRAELADAVIATKEPFEKTAIVSTLFAKMLPDAVDAWENDEAHTIPKPDVADDLMHILSHLKNTSEQTIKEDYATFVNIYALTLRADIATDADTMATYSNEEFTLGLMRELLANERFDDTVRSITEDQISETFTRIGAPKDLKGAYTTLTNGLYNALKTSAKQEDRAEYLKAQNTFVFDSVSLKLSPTAMDTFVMQELQQYKLSLPKKSEFKEFFAQTPIDLLLRDGTVVHEALSSQKQIEGFSHTVSYSAIKLSEEPVKNADTEAKLLMTAFSKMNEFVVLLNASKTADALKAAGVMLDAFADSETVGADNAKAFLTAILQSDKVYAQTGISKIKAVEVAEQIATSGDYAGALGAIANGISVLELSAKGRYTDNTVKELLLSSSKDTAGALKLFFTDYTLQNYGTSRRSAPYATELVGHLFDNLALSYESGIPAELLDLEAAAISDFFVILMHANETAEGNLAFGDDCVTGLSATSHTSRVLNSRIVSQTLVDAVYAGRTTATLNLLKMHTTLSASEESSLLAALNSEWQTAAAQTDELARTLISIASLSNCEVTLEGSEIVLVLPEVEEPEGDGEENI